MMLKFFSISLVFFSGMSHARSDLPTPSREELLVNYASGQTVEIGNIIKNIYTLRCVSGNMQVSGGFFVLATEAKDQGRVVTLLHYTSVDEPIDTWDIRDDDHLALLGYYFFEAAPYLFDVSQEENAMKGGASKPKLVYWYVRMNKGSLFMRDSNETYCKAWAI